MSEVCGTYGGYQRHTRRGEAACEPCRTASREYQRAYRENPAAREASRRASLAQHRARTALVRLHRAEYERLYDAYLSEILAAERAAKSEQVAS